MADFNANVTRIPGSQPIFSKVKIESPAQAKTPPPAPAQLPPQPTDNASIDFRQTLVAPPSTKTSQASPLVEKKPALDSLKLAASESGLTVSASGGLLQLADAVPDDQRSIAPDKLDSFLADLVPTSSSVGTLTHSQFDFDQGSEVVSSAQKFIIPVPRFESEGGEDLVYPAGAKNKEGQDIGGQLIADWQGKPIGGPGEKGVVFFNHKDQSWQAVKADGEGVVILNQVTEEQAAKLQDKLGKDPSRLSLQEFKGALEFAHGDLGIGDMYNSDRTFIKNKMNPLETSDTGIPQYGLFRRDDRDVCHAIYVEGSGEFQGPAASPQKFEDGAVLIRQPNGKEFSYRLIQPDAFQETYKNKDGSAIDLQKLSRQVPREAASG